MPDAGDRARALRIIDRVRSYGVEVRVMPGHETRGGTFVIVPVKVFDHHDASSRKAGEWGSLGLIMDGTPRGIPGPLANAQVARCLDGVPRIAWVADGTCSHGGLGSGLGLPTNAANPRTYGVEKANDGIGEPYTAAANYATNALFHAMAVESGADPATYAWGHKEWTTRKVDPLYSMPDRRRQVGAFSPQEDDMPYTQHQIEDFVYGAVRNLFLDMNNGDNDYAKAPFQAVVAGAVATAVAPLQGQFAGLAEALKQVAAGTGAAVDLAAVTAAAKAGAQAALAEGVDVDVTVGGKPAAS